MSIDVNVQNDLVIVTESSEDITVNVSNAAGPAGANGVGVPVGGTTGQVLKKFTNTNYDTYWAADASGLTSVGLSMPNAFAVSNSPLTSNGTIAVTGAGTASQYIRGDGVLATLPTGGSGGSSVSYYLNGGTAASVGTYYQMSTTSVVGANADFTRTGNGLIAQFLTDAGDPNRLQIPAGNWNFEMFFSMSSNGGTPEFYVELLKYDGTTFTSIASSSAIPEVISGGTIIDLYLTALAIPATALLATDRLALRVYIVNNSGGRTATLHTQDSHLCQIITNFAGGVSALNGLTANTQYFATGTSGTDFAISSTTDTHTFNLPTANGTNRGALSSADWTTFSGKVGGSGATGQVAYWNGTSSQTGSNNLFWDNSNLALNVGINTLTSRVAGWSTIQNGQSIFSSQTSSGYTFFGRNIYQNAAGSSIYINSSSSSIIELSGRDYAYYSATSGTAGDVITLVKHFQIYGATSNLVLQNGGTFTDGGQRLQVYGDAFIKGSGATSATNALLVQNSASSPIFTFRNDGVSITSNASIIGSLSNYFLFSNNAGGTNPKIISAYWNTSTTNGISIQTNLTTQSGVGNGYGVSITNLFNADYTTGAYSELTIGTPYLPTSGTGTYTNLRIGATINQTGGANGITRGLYVNPTLTAAADWRSIEWSNNSGWGLYGAGTSNNYLGGRLGIGNTNPTNILDILTNANNAQYVSIKNSSTGVDASAGYIATNNNNINGGFLVYSSTFANSLYTNNLGIGHNKSIVISTDTNVASGGTSKISFVNGGYSVTPQMTLTAAGRLLLGTTTEGTFLLDVNGTARVSGDLTILNNKLVVQNISNNTAPVMMSFINTGTGSGTGATFEFSYSSSLALTYGNGFTFTHNGSANTTSINSTGVSTVGSLNAASTLNFTSTIPSTIKSNGQATDSFTYIGGGSLLFQNYIGSYDTRFAILQSTGNVIIQNGGTFTDVASARLQVNSTTQGFLPPRMTTTQKNAIGTPAAGLVVYDTDTNKLCCYNGTSWNDLF